jgi:hypothetical protein
VRHIKIYPLSNFEVNPITHFGVISLFSSNFLNFNTFRPLFQKLYETDGKLKLQTCSAYQDLPTLKIWSKSDYSSCSYCLFFIKKNFILILFVLYFKNYLEIDVKFKLQKCAACQDLPTLQFWSKFRYTFWQIMQIRKKGGMKFFKNLLLCNYWANLNQTLLKWSLGCPLSKLCPSAPSCIQDGRHY